ncbi:hypothetical protein TRFO_08137 [Tritrichomonas foetus]|uniref:Uncharacterized protein n=1 Tax=Tritrichomonas foetus TaxID=1144522 RepID=A0A1J4JP01_9EUKA|nr:hypothetical protein TRFO_08137 [Tritrichomonas foetus]|eukprot:OHT00136.1 hypothetical protein TRFO_08137 [Tritrichomonas foetus]
MKDLITPSVDASAVSVSKSSAVVSRAKSNIYLGTYSWTDHIFPLVDYLFQTTSNPPIPSFLVVLMSIFVYIQIALTSIWPAQDFWLYLLFSDNTQMISAFKYIMNIFWFLPVTELDIDLTPMFVGLFLVFLFTIASIVFEIGYYQLNHRFAKWSMYIVRFLCHYVTQVMVHPYAAFTGNSLYLLINFSTGQFWGFFIMGCIMTLGNILIFAATSLFCANSTIFDINLTSTFNPKPLILTLTINAACIIANYIFKMFPLWTILVLQVLHAVFCCFSFIKILLFIDFHTVFGNAIYIYISFFLISSNGCYFDYYLLRR